MNTRSGDTAAASPDRPDPEPDAAPEADAGREVVAGVEADARPEVDAGPVLRAAAAIGPYFVWEPWDGGPGWRPLRELLDPDVVAERVAVGRRVLARMSGQSPDDLGQRVIASITFLGLASRLLSPMLAAAAIGDALPVPDRERMWWRPVEGGPIPIAYRGLTATATAVTATAGYAGRDATAAGRAGQDATAAGCAGRDATAAGCAGRDATAAGCAGQDATAVAHALTRTATRGLVEPVLEVFRRRFALSPHVLWGNVSSALGGAAGMIADALPDRAEKAAAIVERALALPPLRGTATLTRPDPARARWFLIRRNCCLYYRIPGGGVCGDCVLAPQR